MGRRLAYRVGVGHHHAGRGTARRTLSARDPRRRHALNEGRSHPTHDHTTRARRGGGAAMSTEMKTTADRGMRRSEHIARRTYVWVFVFGLLLLPAMRVSAGCGAD